jgi:hypothetical protein
MEAALSVYLMAEKGRRCFSIFLLKKLKFYLRMRVRVSICIRRKYSYVLTVNYHQPIEEEYP